MNAADFEQILICLERSKIYKNFCDELYGTGLIQYNMVTKDQLEKFEQCLALKPTQNLLDIGCGSGTITRYLAEKYRAKTTGIDFAAKAIEIANSHSAPNSKFLIGDISTFSVPEKFDHVIAVDSLYFVQDLNHAIRNLKKLLKPRGTLLAFYTSSVEAETDRSRLTGDSTDLAKELTKNGFDFQFWDFTQSEADLWLRAKRLIELYRDELEEEGNLPLYEGWREACARICPRVLRGLQSRFLYSCLPRG